MEMKKTDDNPTERFVDAVRKIVSVPKKEVERRMAEEKKQRDAEKKARKPV